MSQKLKLTMLLSVTLLASISTVSCISREKFTSKKEQSEIQTESSNSDAQIIKLKEDLKKIKSELKNPYLILCNKDNLLPDDYLPIDIKESKLPFLSYIETTQLNTVATSNAKEMFNAAKESGISLLGASGYRSNAIQTSLFQSNVQKNGLEHTLKYSAPPGSSEHETGLAIDVVSTEYTNLTAEFENTKAFKWLRENCSNYGFILRYPKEKENLTKYSYEPWHYRYVGKEHAKYIMDNNLILEEYISLLNSKVTSLESEIGKE